MAPNEQAPNLPKQQVIDSELAQQTSYETGAPGFTAMPYEDEPTTVGPIERDDTTDLTAEWATHGIGPVELSADERAKSGSRDITEVKPKPTRPNKLRVPGGIDIAEFRRASMRSGRTDFEHDDTGRPNKGDAELVEAESAGGFAPGAPVVDRETEALRRDLDAWDHMAALQGNSRNAKPEATSKVDLSKKRQGRGKALLAAAGVFVGSALMPNELPDTPADTPKAAAPVPAPKPPVEQPPQYGPLDKLTPEQRQQFEQMVETGAEIKDDVAAANPAATPRQQQIQANEQLRNTMQRAVEAQR